MKELTSEHTRICDTEKWWAVKSGQYQLTNAAREGGSTQRRTSESWRRSSAEAMHKEGLRAGSREVRDRQWSLRGILFHSRPWPKIAEDRFTRKQALFFAYHDSCVWSASRQNKAEWMRTKMCWDLLHQNRVIIPKIKCVDEDPQFCDVNLARRRNNMNRPTIRMPSITADKVTSSAVA